MNIEKITLSEQLLRQLSTAKATHQFAMRFLPYHNLGASPRAKTGFQYRIDMPEDPHGVTGSIIISYDYDRQTPELSVGDEVIVTVRLNTISRLNKREIPWPNDQVWERTKAMLERHGMAVLHDGDFDPIRISHAVRRHGVIFRDVLAYVRITDEELFANAWINGIGRAKNYGCGMLTII